MKLTKEEFLELFVVLPIFLLVIHLGYIIPYILYSFFDVIPIFIKITSIITICYVILSIIIYSIMWKKIKK